MTNPAPLNKAAELLPCPFCGGKAKLKTSVHQNEDGYGCPMPGISGYYMEVFCTVGQCKTRKLAWTDDDLSAQARGAVRRRVIEDWNTRPTPAPAPVGANARECVDRIENLLNAELGEWTPQEKAKAASILRTYAQSHADAQTGKLVNALRAAEQALLGLDNPNQRQADWDAGRALETVQSALANWPAAGLVDTILS